VTDPTRSADEAEAAPASSRDERPLAEAVGSLCPYLASATGPWRSLEPSRDHRCTAAAPPDAVTTETQRRYCLGAAHRACPVYAERTREARVARAGLPAQATGRRPLVVTAPVVVERGGRPMPAVIRGRRRVGGQILAAIVVGAAVLAFAVARGPFAGPSATATPSASVAAGLVSASPSPTAPSTASPTPAPTATPRATPRPTRSPGTAKTYTVRPGDSLAGIALKFKTTVAVLVKLNHIADKRIIHAGQVLKLP
jgi:LysM repeat protein